MQDWYNVPARGGSMRLRLALLTGTLLIATAYAQTFKVLYSFSFTDGSLPNGNLLLDAQGNLYGTTVEGGGSNRGIIFKLDSTGHLTTLYSFTGGSDGGLPIGGVIADAAGNLYGVTSLDGDPICSCGTVYKLQTDGTLTVLHAFKGGTDGAQNEGQPELGVIDVEGNLYGSASFGGVSGCDGTLGCGVVYKVTPAGEETVLYAFTAQADGAFPQNLIRDSTGNIYGETGGSYQAGNGGTIFKMDASGNLTTLFTFPEGTYGTSPRWGLVRRVDGAFFGVTQFGGSTTNCSTSSAGCGIVFAVDAQGKEFVLHSFAAQSANDGQEPSGGLINLGDTLYGSTFYGGIKNSSCTFGCGITYGVAPSGKYTVLHRFTGGSDGESPWGTLSRDKAGNLYGATQTGGGTNNGAIFEITP
jgi:uncharacterized repeat protein (TIGR03803 family)